MSLQKPYRLNLISTNHRWLVAILLLALILRLAHTLPQERATIYTDKGGDSWWYLEYGRLLVRGQEPAPPPSGPVYLIFVGLPQWVASPETAILIIRVIQAALGSLTCYFAYRLAWRVSNDERTGLLASTVLAVSPVFVIEPNQILTETLYLCLLSAGMWLFIKLISTPDSAIRWHHPVLLGLILGLTTLTRAVLLMFPLILALYLLVILNWRTTLKYALLMLIVYGITVSTWTVYNRVRWNQWVIGAQGFAAFLFIGASDQGWQGPQQTDAALAQQAGVDGALPTNPSDQQQLYGNAALQQIIGNLGGWVSHRTSELAAAVLQPYGTVYYPGESLKDLTANWWRSDRTLQGLVNLTKGDAFWAKLVIYIFHYAGLLLGIIGMWLARRNWRITLPLITLIFYTLVVHFVLDAIPRYLFPLDLFFWIFAVLTITRWVGGFRITSQSSLA
ncbi:MAG: glycosyltransferase family 39 protein [Anaerolineae bacterium]